MIAALLVIPFLIVSLGNARFAALAMVWTLLGYFSLFDLGLARSLTYRIAQLSRSGDHVTADRAARTGLICLTGMGIIIGTVIAALAPIGAAKLSVMQSGGVLEKDLLQSILIVAIGVPIVMVTAGLRGMLEGRSAFGSLNLILIPMGVMMFVMPALVAWYDQTLTAATATVLAVRLTGALFMGGQVKRASSQFLFFGRLDRAELRILLGFGLWVSASAIIGPLMVYGDRFVLSAMIPMHQIAYYTTAFDVITRAAFVPSAIMAVFFPLMIQGYAEGQQAFRRRYLQASSAIAVAMLLIAVAGILFSLFGIRLWLGSEFARQSVTVALIITVGVALNGLAVGPLAAVQAAGNPALPVKIYAFELPIYVIALWYLTKNYGIVGAAGAWSGRAAIDAIILFAFAYRETVAWRCLEQSKGHDAHAARASVGMTEI